MESQIFTKEMLTNILPHKFPAQMLDSAEFNPEFPDKITGYKEISAEEIWVQGHFPDKPIFPGHCLMECAFLTALTLVKITLPKISGIPMIAQVGKTSFRLPGFAGDNIEFHLTLKNNLNNYIFVFDAIIKNQYREIIARIHDIKGVNNTNI